MNYGQYRAQLALRVGSRTDIDTRILQETQFTQTFLLEGTGTFLPWFLFQGPILDTLSAGNNTVDFATGFLQEREGFLPHWYDSVAQVWRKIPKRSYEYGEDLKDVPGPPTSYTLVGDQFFFHPAADQNYQIRFFYYQRESTLTQDSDTNGWLTHAADLLMAETGLVLAENHIQDDRMAQSFKVQIDRARQRLWTLSEAKDNVNRKMQLGED